MGLVFIPIEVIDAKNSPERRCAFAWSLPHRAGARTAVLTIPQLVNE